ncbi:bifunctional glutamate--cysteine ligase/glutathione synthetase, partial [Lactobacillus sp. UMNPBX10]
NHAEIKVSYENLQQYVETLEHWVRSGKLIAEKEFYSNIRFRGAKKQVRELLEKGIRYLEFRLFDLNPFAQYGIELEDAEFIHYFVLLMLWLEQTADQGDVEKGREMLAEVALEHPLSITAYQQEGLALFDQ